MSTARTPSSQGRRAILGALVVLSVLVASREATGLWVDALWFAEAGFSTVFNRLLVWVWGMRAVAVLGVTLFVFVNLRVVGASLSSVNIRRRFGNIEISERIPLQYVTSVVLALSLLFGLWFGAAVPEDVGQSALLLRHAGSWGLTDPVLGYDIGFYVFALPLLRAVLTFALVISFLVSVVCVAGYATTGVLRVSEGGMVMTDSTRMHLGLLLAGFLLLLAVRFEVGRALLLLTGTSDVQGIFGFTDATARLPGLRIQALLTAAGAFSVGFAAWRNRLMPAVVGFGLVLVGFVGVGQLYPSFVQRFQVVPNELARETPWIEHNLAFTRHAFGVDAMERAPYAAQTQGEIDWTAAMEQFAGLPTWTPNTLLTTYREVEARFRYYHFPTLAFDRYESPDGPVPVALAVREVDPAGIEDPNWQNLHLRERYVVGNGIVASAATERTPEGRPAALVDGIPALLQPGAPASLQLDRTSIFYGARAQPYALVSPTPEAYQAPDGTPGVPGVDLPLGIEVGGFARKAVFAWYLREANLLFSADVRPDSRLVLHRDVLSRVRRIAPLLTFAEAPYAVVHEGRVVWIVEGFTQTRFFPLSQPASLEFGRATAYARNSVKATVDAVTGDVAFFAVPGADPLRDAIAAAFPGLIKPMEAMPEGLRSHLRYSRALLDLQADVLLQYHQNSPAVFFGQQDLWATPRELAEGTNPVTYEPEYGLYRLPGDDAPEFRLVTVFVPAGRQNLTGVLSGELTPDGAPRLRLFDVPVENQLPGPRQVEALIEQDPDISQQFSLWRTGGSRVWTGHLHVVPVGERLVYMEPVFLAAEADAIPELRRFVVSDGQRVAMDETLAGAVGQLAGLSVGLTSEPPSTSALPTVPGAGTPPAGSNAEALRWLDIAERRLREGDWAGFGQALDEVRRALRGAPSGAATNPPSGASPSEHLPFLPESRP